MSLGGMLDPLVGRATFPSDRTILNFTPIDLPMTSGGHPLMYLINLLFLFVILRSCWVSLCVYRLFIRAAGEARQDRPGGVFRRFLR